MSTTNAKPEAARSSEIPESRLLAASGFVAGVLIVVAFVAEVLTPVPPGVLGEAGPANWTASQSDLALWAFRSYAWGLFAIAGIPFFTLVGRVLRTRNPHAALVGSLLSAIGLTLYCLRGILQDSAFALAGTLPPPTPGGAAYEEGLLFGMVNPLLPLGGAVWGLGFIFLGALTWRRGILPRWLAIVAFIGGVAGWLIFPVINSFGLFPAYGFTEILVPLSTAIWGFTFGVVFLRRSLSAGPAAGPAPS
jgi:uncharacterized protein DUF4386